MHHNPCNKNTACTRLHMDRYFLSVLFSQFLSVSVNEGLSTDSSFVCFSKFAEVNWVWCLLWNDCLGGAFTSVGGKWTSSKGMCLHLCWIYVSDVLMYYIHAVLNSLFSSSLPNCESPHSVVVFSFIFSKLGRLSQYITDGGRGLCNPTSVNRLYTFLLNTCTTEKEAWSI
jgi:hypothetical protein